jgi:TnsA endonuclease N terminal
VAARSQPFTEELYLSKLKAGRGRGEGADYRPWVSRDELLSKGTRFLAHCGRFDREVHLLSTTEHKGYHFYDACLWVRQIREQVLLDREETLDIASEAGIPHPMDRNTRQYVAMTTDLVIDGVDSRGRPIALARSCKPASDLEVFNNIEHAEIERRYWKRHGRQWAFFTDAQSCMPDLVYQNLELMRPNRFLHKEAEPYPGCFNEVCDTVQDAVLSAGRPQRLGDFAKTVQPLINGRYSAAKVILFLIYRGRLTADLSGAPFLDQDVIDIARASAALVTPQRRFA